MDSTTLYQNIERVCNSLKNKERFCHVNYIKPIGVAKIKQILEAKSIVFEKVVTSKINNKRFTFFVNTNCNGKINVIEEDLKHPRKAKCLITAKTAYRHELNQVVEFLIKEKN